MLDAPQKRFYIFKTANCLKRGIKDSQGWKNTPWKLLQHIQKYVFIG